MALNQNDRTEIRTMLSDLLDRIKDVHAEQMRGVNDKLERIEEQTRRTNGRVTAVEQKVTALEHELPHSMERCPQKERIQSLLDNQMTSKALSRLLIKSITITGVIVGIITSIIMILEK